MRALLVTDPLLLLSTVIMGSVSICSSLADRDGHLQDRIARRWARLLLRIAGVEVRVRGLQNLDADCNYVFVGNHTSLMDTPVALASIPRRFLFVANEKYFRIPVLGTHLRRAGHLAVDMSDPRTSLRTAAMAAQCIRTRRLSILLFPEGTRAKMAMHEFKEGAAFIAIKAGAPVVPMAIEGTRDVLPAGSIYVRPGPVTVTLGKPLPTEGLSLRDRGPLTRAMQANVEALLRA
jgi:1-acyl-sn-glycerol-3-phosphate acyltransferase